MKKVKCEIELKLVENGKVIYSIKEKYQTPLIDNGVDLVCTLKGGVRI